MRQEWKQEDQLGKSYSNLGWKYGAWAGWSWWRAREVVRFVIYLESKVMRIH